MADLKHILVVDDHFDMLEFLRSMLETSNANYRVLGVPSAEEGLLELKRRSRQGEPFDLLITDVRLPGMSGFELARKVRDLRPDMAILIITAYASVQGRQEAEMLDVHRYFEKPLDTDALLASVHSALYADSGASPAVTRPASRPQQSVAQPTRQQQRPDPQPAPDVAVRRRLHALLSDTGAVQALLCDRQGRIRYRVGAETKQPLERVATLLARTLKHSFELAAELGSAQPFTIQYQAGEHVDLYTANVARYAFLILLFDARARRGRIGTVWIFAQRAIKDLLDLIPEIDLWDEAAFPATPAANAATRAASKETPTAHADRREGQAETPQAELPPDARPPADSASVPDEPPAPGEPTGRETRETAPDAALPELTFEDAAGEEALLDLLEQAADLPGVDLDAFWEEITADAGRGDMQGLSFEEAVERGLLPPDLGG